LYTLNGTVTSPAYSFTNAIDTGMYLTSATVGSRSVTLCTDGDEVVSFTSGAAATANYFNLTSSTSGTSPIISTIGADTNINLTLTPKGTGTVLFPNGTVAAPGISFAGDTDTGLYSLLANVLGISVGAGLRMLISTSSISAYVPIFTQSGTASTPTYTFSGSSTTGIYSAVTNTISFTTNGTNRLTIDTTSLATTLPVYALDGTATNPAYTFTSDTNTGPVSYTHLTLPTM
jgi:hypothetical protein